jgi:hypothetical protein
LAYICSAARSGSTLLNRLIGSHPLALPAGEVARLSKNIALDTKCSCGATVSTCSFWRPVVERLGADEGHDLWADPYALELGAIRAVSEVDRTRQTRLYIALRASYMAWLELSHRAGVDVARSRLVRRYGHWLEENARVHEALRREGNRRIVVDSSKGFRFATGLYQLRPTNTRIILLTRDGRGVVSSYLRSGMNLETSVRNWITYYERATEWIKKDVAPEHVLRVKYEDVVSNPETELNRIFRFLDLPPIHDTVELRRGDSHILAGNRGALRDATEIKNDDRWKRDLTNADLAYIMRVGGGVMSQLGYLPLGPAD